MGARRSGKFSVFTSLYLHGISSFGHANATKLVEKDVVRLSPKIVVREGRLDEEWRPESHLGKCEKAPIEPILSQSLCVLRLDVDRSHTRHLMTHSIWTSSSADRAVAIVL